MEIIRTKNTNEVIAKSSPNECIQLLASELNTNAEFC